MAGIIFSKSSNVNNSVFGKVEAPIRAFLEQAVTAAEKESLLGSVFKKVKSNKFAEKFTSLTSLAHGFQPVPEGGAYPRDERQEGFSKVIEPTEWKDSFAITKPMIEDSVVLDMTRIGATSFVQTYKYGLDTFAGAALAGAVKGDTFNYKGQLFDCTTADKKALFAMDHPSATGNADVQSNKFAGEFSADMLGLISTAMQNITDDNGATLALAPDTIIIPNDYQLKKAVFAAIGSDKDPDTANNGFNYLFGQWRVIVSPFLNGMIDKITGDKPFMVMDSKFSQNYNGLIHVERVPLSVHSWIDENTDNNVWNGRYRMGIGFNDWRSIAVGGVTGGTELS